VVSPGGRRPRPSPLLPRRHDILFLRLIILSNGGIRKVLLFFLCTDSLSQQSLPVLRRNSRIYEPLSPPAPPHL
jgi:hypothetical protein